MLPGERVPGCVCADAPRAALPRALQPPRHLSARETTAGEREGSPRKAEFAALKDHDLWGCGLLEGKIISRMDTILTHSLTVIGTFPPAVGTAGDTQREPAGMCMLHLTVCVCQFQGT